MEFKRTESTDYPHVYRTFKVKVRDGDEVEEFVIQDLTENFFDAAVDMIYELHAKGAVFHRAAKTLTNKKSEERVRTMYRKHVEEKVSLICLKTGTDEIVGINIMGVKCRGFVKSDTSGDPSFQVHTEASNYLYNAFDVMEHYQVDQLLLAVGLCVDQKFRGRGIATEILKTRADLMKSIGLELTTTIFSTVGAQKAAKAAGYDENYSISYEDFQEKFPAMDFSHVFKTHCKVLSLKI